MRTLAPLIVSLLITSICAPGSGWSQQASADTAPAPVASAHSSTPKPVPSHAGCIYHQKSATPAGGVPTLGPWKDLPGTNRKVDSSLCDAQACGVGFMIQVGASAPVPDGNYRVVVETEWGKTSCAMAYKKPAFKPSADCGQAAELTHGCAAPPDVPFGPIYFQGTPKRVKVVIEREGKVVADKSFTPTYSAKRPDGFECAASCRGAATQNVAMR